MKDPVSSEYRERQAQIESIAYQRWEDAGSPPGDALCFWLRAEREVAEMLKAATRIVLDARNPRVSLR